MSEASTSGKRPLFAQGKPTGNLFRPNIDSFLAYSRTFFENRRYTDDGELSRMLESRLAEFHAVARAVALVSGFWGHVLAISALALPGRREIIAPAFGYRRTDDMIAWSGFVPHFCDVDPQTLAISVSTIQAALTDETALILAPNPMVNCCGAEEIESFAREHRIPLIFDSVEAAYRVYNNRRIGGFGDAEVFSMHATKLLNGFEGGYVTTNNARLADLLDRTKRFGLEAAGTVSHVDSLNAKLNEVHAAMALASLDEVEGQVADHHGKYDLYVAGLRDIDGLEILQHDPAQRPDYRLIVVRIGKSWPLSRAETLRLLEAENVLARPYYEPLTHKVVDYARICPDLPVTEAIFGEFMVLPSGAHVSTDDVRRIIDMLRDIRQHGSVRLSPRITT